MLSLANEMQESRNNSGIQFDSYFLLDNQIITITAFFFGQYLLTQSLSNCPSPCNKDTALAGINMDAPSPD